MSLLNRFLALFRSRSLERELNDEVRFHLDERIAAHVRRGMTEAEATEAALRQFGNVGHVKDGMREVHMVSRKVVGAFVLGLTIGALASATALMWRVKPVSMTALPSDPPFYRVGEEGVISPVMLHEVKPKYTAEAMRAKITGTVVVECIVVSTGACVEVHVTKPLDPDLDRNAVNSVQSWRFEPGKRQGKPVPVLVSIQIAFSLR